MSKPYLHITLCANNFSSGSSQYTWDANGNLVSDSGKGVVSVSYNRFNLPVAVDLGDRGDITFTYDGLGRKLSMSSRPKLTINPLAKSAPKEIDGGKIDGGKIDGGKIDGDFPVADIDFFSRFYYDNLIFKGTQLERILFPGGYITPSGTEYIYHYYVTDRQGNVRAVVRDGNLVEANDYYPYGMLMADAEGKIPDKQPYKLSGKEYITTRGLNLYDFGARMHDPAAMRFSTPDPLMEQYPSLSPYTYCAANPLKYIDPTGMKIVNTVVGAEGTFIDEIIDYLSNHIFFGQVVSAINESPYIFTIGIDKIAPVDGFPAYGRFRPDPFFTTEYIMFHNDFPTIRNEITLNSDYLPLDMKSPFGHNYYNYLAEELYHAFQSITFGNNSNNIEFEAHLAAYLASFDKIGMFIPANGVSAVPPINFSLNCTQSMFDYIINVIYITFNYQVLGGMFSEGSNKPNTPHYNDPVSQTPDRLIELLKNVPSRLKNERDNY